MAHDHTFQLPLSIVSPSDLKRVRRELDNLNDALLQTEIREGGQSQVKLPKTSKQLDNLVDINKIHLLHKKERENLAELLSQLIDKAPVLHMSFTSEPSSKFLEKLITYLRDSMDPYAVVTVGLAPSIGAGCLVRTKNKYFDLSLKESLNAHKGELVKGLREAGVTTNHPQGAAA